jgi:hypothetical protein
MGECIDGMILPILSLTISLALCGDLYAEMVWEKFLRAVMYPGNHSELLRHISEADLVIGGVDMTISYL